MNSGLTAGLAGASQYGCVALATGGELAAVCEQQRVTRVRGAGFNASGVPDEALDVLLNGLGRTRADVTRYATAGEQARPRIIEGKTVECVDHHMAHACTAYLSSSFSSAVIVVCDHEAPAVSVWNGSGSTVTALEWPWQGWGFADLYAACARVLGFEGPGASQRFEALARLQPDYRDARANALFQGDGTSLTAVPGWQRAIEDWVGGSPRGSIATARVAAALQGRIGELFLELLGHVRARTNARSLCLAGGLFYHSSLNTIAKRSGLFEQVFIPVDPGDPGLAVGAALHATSSGPRRLSAFLGPEYDATEIKATLDNCKLRYDWEQEDAIIAAAVDALKRGALVGWFEGRMEWGPRALGARSILANPFSPYVLENLNGFLKRREPWRGYALSALPGVIHEHFDGPEDAPHMESDCRARDTGRFRHLLPGPNAAVRVQSVDGSAPPRFRRLLAAFGAATGIPCVVNTSFNGFHEPIVCSPRDALRVFYGSGVDVLILDRFILKK